MSQPTETWIFRAETEGDTERLGAALADVLPDASTVALQGTLGAGKTRLVQAIAAALGVAPGEVTSPTFVLCQQYQGRRTMLHLDAYRLRDLQEFTELGADEFFEFNPGLIFIEWADRVAKALPDERLEIAIEILDENSRQFHITPLGGPYGQAVAALKERLAGGA